MQFLSDTPRSEKPSGPPQSSEREINEAFRQVQLRIYRRFRKNPDIAALLFLIGIRELGQVKQKFTKEEKVAVMNLALCRLMSYEGYYVLEGLDEKGWPCWTAIRPLPAMSSEEQELLLKRLIIRYFADLP